MKRASILISALAGMIAASGCVSQAEYDKLYSMYESTKNAKTQLAADLEKSQQQLADTTAERDRLVKEKDALNTSWRAQYDKLQAAYEAAIANAGAPVVNIQGPLPRALDEALQKFAKEYGLEYDPARGAVRFSSDLLFDLGSYALKAEVNKQLADFAKIVNMPEARDFDVLVVGHTDGVPVTRAVTKEHTPTNWHLSVYRAVSVVQAFQAANVDPKRLGAMGFGAERPRPGTTNATKAPGTKENRRVEVFLVPKKSLSGTASSMAPFGLGISGVAIAGLTY